MLTCSTLNKKILERYESAHFFFLLLPVSELAPLTNWSQLIAFLAEYLQNIQNIPHWRCRHKNNDANIKYTSETKKVENKNLAYIFYSWLRQVITQFCAESFTIQILTDGFSRDVILDCKLRFYEWAASCIYIWSQRDKQTKTVAYEVMEQ